MVNEEQWPEKSLPFKFSSQSLYRNFTDFVVSGNKSMFVDAIGKNVAINIEW